MTQGVEDMAATLREVRHLLLEREKIKRQLDAIDRAIALAVGIDGEDRPKKPRLSQKDIGMLIRTGHNERIPAKKR